MVAFSDLVVVVPGILGSRLVRREGRKKRVVWDLSIRHLPRMLKEVAAGGLEIADDDGIEADALFNYQLLPGFFGVDDYDSLVETLRRSVGESQVVTYPYDWRRSNRLAAEGLSTTVDAGLQRLREAGAQSPKVWLISHSMGGLVARYYCEHLGGAAKTRAVITLGTPHRGSVNALDVLVNGKRLGVVDLSALVRRMPSIYELLPLFPVLRTGQGVERRLLRIAEAFDLDPVTGEDASPPDGRRGPSPIVLPGLDRGMVQDSLRFHAKIRVPAERRAADGGRPLYAQRAILNRRQHTAHSAAVNGGRLTTYLTYPVQDDGNSWREDDARGDGTVPGQSAVPIEWADTADAIPLAEKHAALPGTREAQDLVQNWLLPARASNFRGGTDELDTIVLDVPAVADTGATVHVTLSAGRPMFGTLKLTDVTSGAELTQRVSITTEPGDVELTGLGPGVHQITAAPRDRSKPGVSDYVYIAGAEEV